MKNYLRHACTVCNRTIDKLVDPQRFIPDKCTITLNCQGRLVPVEYRSNAEITASPRIGLNDWYPRGSTFSGATGTEEDVLLNALSGEAGQLVLAVQLATPPSTGSTALLTLSSRSASPKEYRQFIFRRESEFLLLSGVEDGAARKTLRYDVTGVDPDLVEVFVNGERREQGLGPLDFQLNDGSANPAVAPNTISFNTPVSVSGITQVDVIVSKVAALESVTLTFERNTGSPARPTGAWENISAIQRGGATYYLFTHDVGPTSGLPLNSILYPTGTVVISAINHPLTSTHLLLARKPFTQVDRYRDIFVNLGDLDGQADYLKYYEFENNELFEVTERTLQTAYPPSTLIRFSPELTIKEVPDSVDEQLSVDGNVIVGPDQ